MSCRGLRGVGQGGDDEVGWMLAGADLLWSLR